MSKKLDSILSRVPPAVTTETNMTNNLENRRNKKE